MTDARRTLALDRRPGTLLTTALADADEQRYRTAIRVASVLLMTALTAAAAQISVPLWFTPVPFTLQPMVVLLGAAVLGPWLGAASQLLYLALGVAGAPVFAFSPDLPYGAARLLGPTGGYLMAYPAAAYVTGWLASRGLGRRYGTAVLAMAAGLVIVFAGGLLWLSNFMPGPSRLDAALRVGLYPFAMADVLKLCVAATLLPGLWRLTGLGRRA